MAKTSKRRYVKGGARLRRTLRSLPEDIGSEVATVIRQVSELVVADAKAGAPLGDTGKLKTSLRYAVTKDGLSSRIGSFGGKYQRAYHAALVEFGSAPGLRKSAAGRYYDHPGTRAKPYLLPAWNRHKTRAFTLLKAATLEALERASGMSKDFQGL